MLPRGLLVLLCTTVLFCRPAYSQVDATLQYEAFGTAVVQATRLQIDRLNSELRANHRFFRRIAWVETADGTSQNTYSDPAYDGGIWRVDHSVYMDTLAMSNNQRYASIFRNIEDQLRIRWDQSTWGDCRRPLYSALAARLFFHGLQSDIPRRLNAQARLWNEMYHVQPTQTVEDFISKVRAQREGCPVKGIDLVFVLDSSGSVTLANFNIIKNFVSNVVNSFDIRADRTRVGLIQYSTDIRVEFNLNAYTDKTLLTEAINSITYWGDSTDTVSALETLESQAFLVVNGARPDNQGVPRVAVIITDGRSQEGPAAVAVPAEQARARGITLFAIGVTDNVNVEELYAIANRPNDTYVFHVSSFIDMSDILATLQDSTCNAPSTLRAPVLNNSLSLGNKQFLAQPITENGITLGIEADQGHVVMYVSTITPNPNEAFHDYRLEASKGLGRAEVFIRPELFTNETSHSLVSDGAQRQIQAPSLNDTADGSPIGTVYMTLEGLQDTNDFVLRLTEGDVTTVPTVAAASQTVADMDLHLKLLIIAVLWMNLPCFRSCGYLE